MDEGGYGRMGRIAFAPRADTADNGSALIIENMQRELARLKAENERLRNALEWVRDSTLETSQNIIHEADEVLDSLPDRT